MYVEWSIIRGTAIDVPPWSDNLIIDWTDLYHLRWGEETHKLGDIGKVASNTICKRCCNIYLAYWWVRCWNSVYLSGQMVPVTGQRIIETLHNLDGCHTAGKIIHTEYCLFVLICWSILGALCTSKLKTAAESESSNAFTPPENLVWSWLISLHTYGSSLLSKTAKMSTFSKQFWFKWWS